MFAERLQESRKKAGFSKAELGRLIGVSRASIGSMEDGSTKAATPENLFKIASVLDCDTQ